MSLYEIQFSIPFYPRFSSSASVILEIRRGGVRKLTSPLFFK
jgi:hypothetical protein